MPGKGGVPWGGSGINATPMDLAKVAWAATNGGRYKGHQVLPGWYLKEATAKQIDTWGTGHNEDRSQGYGYQIWRMSNNSFAFVGLGLQLALCLRIKISSL
jgi:CubicO group peptidase (beta-lactamase class C family)